MRLIDRLNHYLESKKITAYAFEKTCGVGNGYLGKQSKGKGSVGSDILEKIGQHYPDLNLEWLITGKGKMLQRIRRDKKNENYGSEMKEDAAVYTIRNRLIEVLKEQLGLLESPLLANDKKQKPAKRKKT